MTEDDLARITAWVVQQGIAGTSETELLHGFCERCRAAGLGLARGLTFIDTLHPNFEGRAFRWRDDGVAENASVEYGRSNQEDTAVQWQNTTFFHLLETGADEICLRLDDGGEPRFWPLAKLRDEGQTHYLALVHRFAGGGIIGTMDCVYSHWTTDLAQGFADPDIEALRRLVPSLALAIKSASLARVAETLVAVYLGRDAGRRVLSGRIRRGVADRIAAVLWFSELRGYTTIADTASPEEVIPLLDDYADAVISSIHDAGGDVLKLIGDGTLAIFTADDTADACRCALKAETKLRRRVEALNQRREGEGRPVTSVYLGLHIGDVFYGNIGSEDRLDFTVVGPAVNEVSRIASLCRSVDQQIVISADFAAATPEPDRGRLVSVGRYALRGVGRAQELFTLEPTIA